MTLLLTPTNRCCRYETFVLFRKFHTSLKCDKIVPKNAKGKSSHEWLTRQLNDPYVKKAQDLNYRARSAFKLIQIDDKLKILKSGSIVVECGAAPGAWTQVAVKRINSEGTVKNAETGTIVAVDLLHIDPLPGAILFPFSDFTDSKVREEILKIPNIKNGVDVVLSDMAPNASGVKETDHYRIIDLAKSALLFALENSKTGSHFVTKVWAGRDLTLLENEMLKYYKIVKQIKPPSSRSDSSEVFLCAKSKK